MARDSDARTASELKERHAPEEQSWWQGEAPTAGPGMTRSEPGSPGAGRSQVDLQGAEPVSRKPGSREGSRLASWCQGSTVADGSHTLPTG